MVKMQTAKEMARKAIESTYEGVVTIEEYQKVKDEVTKLTSSKVVVVLENQPCRLSFERLQVANQTEAGASVTQSVKLFLAPEVCIKAGSKITVTQAGKTTAYTYSGIPAIYDTHQEIRLELFQEWA